MAEILKAVAYARFSSELQREESIDAQIRAIKQFAEQNGYALQKVYADRGISGTTDKRPEFQHMIDDAKTATYQLKDKLYAFTSEGKAGIQTVLRPKLS